MVVFLSGVVVLSLVAQVCAATFALRFFFQTRHRLAWGLLAFSSGLMCIRRVAVLFTILDLGVERVSAVSEYLGLFISVAMAAGLWGMRNYFLSSAAANRALEDSLAREKTHAAELEAVMQTVPAIVWVAGDMAKAVFRANRAAQDFMAQAGPPEEMRAHQDGSELSASSLPMHRAATEGVAITDFEADVITKDGQTRTLYGNASPLHDAEGAVSGAVGAFLDVTERRRTEKALRESEERFRLLAQNIPGTIYLCQNDPNYTMVHLNDEVERLTGYGAADFLEKRVAYGQLIHSDDRGRVADEIARAVGAGLAFHLSYRILHRSGEWRWVEEVGGSFQYGDAPLLEGFMQDVTEKRHAEEERRELDNRIRETQKLESLGVLAGGVAHDFNNLLLAIIGNADLARMSLPRTSPVKEHLLDIETAARRAADLCKQMLAYSGRGKFMPERISLNEVIEGTLPMLEVSISKRVALRTQFARDLPPIEADTGQMRQLMMNLAVNASEAIGDNYGVVTLATGLRNCDERYFKTSYLSDKLAAGTYVFLEVTDTGCGMDDETRERIFEPFFSTKFTGRGLGMPAVLGIVRGHNGAIKVYSEPGKGSTFLVLFPALEAQSADELSREEKEPVGWKGTGTVLLVDDEDSVRSVGKRMLVRAGFDVLLARDGKEALELFRQRADEIACVLLDVTMPNMDGEECYRSLREIRADVPVILSSGYTEQFVSERFIGEVPAGFIQKPYVLGNLVEALREALGE
jgi:PAS domain S-box-containing protein